MSGTFREGLIKRINWQQELYEFDGDEVALKIKHVLEDVLMEYDIKNKENNNA